jgi:flagellar hook-associated protein 2
MALAQQPLTTMQNQVSTIQSQESVYNTLSTDIAGIATAANNVSAQGAFNTVSATSSNTSTATITTTNASAAGNYNLSVTQLAQAQKVASSAFTDTTSGLGLSAGTFTVDGKAVSVNATDSLQSIAQKINSLGVGVTASLINGGSGSAYLTLASQNSGAANTIQMADVSGNALSSLGLTSSTGSPTIRQSITNGAASEAFTSSTSSIATMTGVPSGSSGTFTVNGTSFNINYDTDSLQSIANEINGANIGVTASIQTNTNSGSATTYQLNIASSSGSTAPTFTDPNNLLQGIGVLQQAPANQLVKAQDANYSLDGINLTSSSNTITTAIPGSTLTLLSGSSSSPATSTLSLTQDTSTIDSNIQSFTSAFNTVVDYINQNSTYNSTNNTSGPLFGDPVAEQAQSQLNNMIFSNVSGLTGSYTNLASIGFSYTSTGDLTVNTSILNQALASDPSGVAALFQATGSGSNANLSYVSSTSSTVPTGSGSYNVDITQPATQATFTAAQQQTSDTTASENLIFSGSAFGSSGTYVMPVTIGNSLQETINQINSDSTLKNVVVASNNNGYLTLTSKLYGSSGDFSVISSSPASSSDSGVGTAGEGTMVNGQDVAGTINGEAATGNGQFLTGKSGNKTTDGLQIQYTGTSTGSVGSVSYTNGIAVQLATLAGSFTDPTNGVIATAEAGMNQQITDLQASETALQTQLTDQQTNLQNEFNSMETAMATAQRQSTQLTSMVNGLPSW